MTGDSYKYVFVCGLHRSGTTILAHEVGKLRDCTAFHDTGVKMDEGQHLQSIYPSSYVYGGAGRFGFASRAHLTENSPLLTPENVSRLRCDWERYWDQSKSIRVEKTPGNLLMMPFLQAAFENAYFIVIKRHPVPVSLATRKWKPISLPSLFEHWEWCHNIFAADRTRVRHLYEVRYEDYIQNPDEYLDEIAAFIGTARGPSPVGKATDAHNMAYFARWTGMLQGSGYYRLVARLYDGKFAEHGYWLREPFLRTPLQGRQGDSAVHTPGEGLGARSKARAFFWHKWSGLEARAEGLLRRYGTPAQDRTIRKLKGKES